MNKNVNQLLIEGIPSNLSDKADALFRARLGNAFNGLQDEIKSENLNLTIKYGSKVHVEENKEKNEGNRGKNEVDIDKRAKQYQTQSPRFTFDQLIISDSLKEDILANLNIISLKRKIFDEWGLRKIEPFPSAALNFYGEPGTGKTLAAHAIANYLGKQILEASYADIESMYHGEGPKNVKAIFLAAQQNNAVLFIDEADSLLSKRLTNVTHGSEQAINSMRSQIFINLQEYSGIVIFSTNLVQNYDKAFETRVRHIEFKMPDEDTRQKIWKHHLPSSLPLAEDISLIATELSKIDNVCGRDIKNAVIDAAVRVASKNQRQITLIDLTDAIERIKASRAKIEAIHGMPLSPSEEKEIIKIVNQAASTNTGDESPQNPITSINNREKNSSENTSNEINKPSLAQSSLNQAKVTDYTGDIGDSKTTPNATNTEGGIVSRFKKWLNR